MATAVRPTVFKNFINGEWMESASGLAFEDHKDRKSTRLNSSHRCISYAVFCLKKKIEKDTIADKAYELTFEPEKTIQAELQEPEKNAAGSAAGRAKRKKPEKPTATGPAKERGG